MAISTLFDDDVQIAPVGLVYHRDFLSVEEEAQLVEWIDAQPWDVRWSRRRQFYGWSYRDETPYSEIPALLAVVAKRLHQEGFVLVEPEHVLINEYQCGQGIAAHVDEMPHPDSQVVTISLCDTYPMEFVHMASGERFEQWLERRSVAVMSGPSRIEWTHEIVKRKADVIQGGGRRQRGRRISITYRTKIGLGEKVAVDKDSSQNLQS